MFRFLLSVLATILLSASSLVKAELPLCDDFNRQDFGGTYQIRDYKPIIVDNKLQCPTAYEKCRAKLLCAPIEHGVFSASIDVTLSGNGNAGIYFGLTETNVITSYEAGVTSVEVDLSDGYVNFYQGGYYEDWSLDQAGGVAAFRTSFTMTVTITDAGQDKGAAKASFTNFTSGKEDVETTEFTFVEYAQMGQYVAFYMDNNNGSRNDVIVDNFRHSGCGGPAMDWQEACPTTAPTTAPTSASVDDICEDRPSGIHRLFFLHKHHECK